MSIADEIRGKNPNPATARPQRPTTAPRSEGGGDMALVLTGAIQSQAVALATAAQAANLSIDHAAEQISDYMASVMSGEALLTATLVKAQQKLESRGQITIESGVQTFELNLPSVNHDQARSGFMAAFGPKEAPTNPWTAAIEAAKAEQGEGNV